MSMATLEREILAEAKKVTGNTKLKMKEILEWCSGEIEPQSGEKTYYLPTIGIYIAIAE